MPLTFKTSAGNGNFKSVPAGTHIAICNMVADLGIQPGSGMYPEPKHQIYIRFEVPEERVSYERDGKKMEGPIVLGQKFTASMNEKANLRKQLENWRGKAFTDDEAENFDVASILGQACMLSVVETTKGEKTYSNIKAISGLPKGMTRPTAENPLLIFDNDHLDTFSKLPPWLQEAVNKQQAAEEKTYSQPSNDGSYDFGDQPPVEAYANIHGVDVDNSDVPF